MGAATVGAAARDASGSRTTPPAIAPPSSGRIRLKACSAASLRRPSSRIGGRWCGGRAAMAASRAARAQRAPGRQPPPRWTEQAACCSAEASA
ncbi:hypothetical protein [Sphingomonas sp. NFR04]|uniref:hypothetical protein n=1 Tax=Sphingomonas sp. NFR04 TaxID=1566283 RepID=UPI000B862FB7|nr:hypothetical protein [Sphingomonas sp. NFR04]